MTTNDAERRSRALLEIAEERARQIDEEGFDVGHDDEHNQRGELVQAAACYAVGAPLYGLKQPPDDPDGAGEPAYFSVWPWPERWQKPQTRRRDLVRAGALILAELDRLDRWDLPYRV